MDKLNKTEQEEYMKALRKVKNIRHVDALMEARKVVKNNPNASADDVSRWARQVSFPYQAHIQSTYDPSSGKVTITYKS